MPKIDPTTQFINDRQNKPDFVRTDIDPNDAPPNRINVPRLCFNGFREPLPFRFESLEQRAIHSAMPNHAFFLDTCFVKKEVPDSCWDALLSKIVCITPWIDFELRQWQADPRVNAYFHNIYHACKAGSPGSVTFLPDDHEDEEIAKAVLHYVSLLCFRKEVFKTIHAQLTAKDGNEPSEERVHAEVQRLVRERGMKIAMKGRDDDAKPNFVADEDLIVRAFAFALTTGRDVTILTRDKDLSEQFFKLQYLIDTHYRSLLLGNAFAKQPLNFRRFDDPDARLSMDGFEELAIYQMPAGMADRVLPTDYQFVNVHVDRITESGSELFHSVLGFSADVQMVDVLRTKGRTGGLNTDQIPGKNLHRCIHPELQEDLGHCVAIVQDRFFEDGGDRWTLTDIQLALTPCERAGELKELEQPDSRAEKLILAQAFDIANFQLPLRLTPTHAFERVSTSLESVSLAIELMKPWTRFLVGSEMSGEIPPRLATALATKDSYCLRRTDDQNSFEPISPIPADEGRMIVDYYTALLAHRKMFGQQCQSRLRIRLGREPSVNEVRNELQEYCDPSCWLRAEYFLQRPNDPFVFDDEHLLVDAVFRAICNGRETVVLTRNPVLVDQFWTLVSTIQGHYRAWAVAKKEKKRLLSLPLGSGKPAPAFESQLFKLEYSAAFVDRCLPSESLEVGVQVWFVEGDLNDRFQVYPVGFPVEPAMAEMLQCKEKNEFRVSDWDNPRNVHLTYCQDDDGDRSATCFVGVDKYVKIGSSDFPADARLPLMIESVPAFDITLMTALDRNYPFPWARVEQARVRRNERKKRKRKRRLSKAKYR